MLSQNFRHSCIIVFSFLFSFILGKILLLYSDLSFDIVSRIILLNTFLWVMLYFYRKNYHQLQPTYAVNSDVVKYKLYSYAAILFLSCLWSYVASLLDAGYIEYTIDILMVSPFLLGLLYKYTLWVDTTTHDNKDDYYYFGYHLLSRQFNLLWQDKHFLRIILLKSLFLPFMYSITLGGIERLLYLNHLFNFNYVFSNLLAFGIMIDVIVGAFGYVITSRVINNKIIDVEHNSFGWFFCLICYPPFYYFLHHVYPVFDYPMPATWSTYVASGVLFIQAVCWVIYWWSTMEFGFNFSNLTWRGLVDTGPYKYLKHPAYLSKNLYWWLSLLPYWITVDFDMKIKLALGLATVSFVYYCRAKCEEHHLKKFYEYRMYHKKLTD